MYIEKVKQLKYLIDMSHNIDSFYYNEKHVKISLIVGKQFSTVTYTRDEIDTAIEHVKNVLYSEIKNSEESVSSKEEYDYLKDERDIISNG